MTLLAAWHSLDSAERRARLRCLQGLARVIGGPASRELTDALRAAETDMAALAISDAALAALPTILLRRIWPVSLRRCRWIGYPHW